MLTYYTPSNKVCDCVYNNIHVYNTYRSQSFGLLVRLSVCPRQSFDTNYEYFCTSPRIEMELCMHAFVMRCRCAWHNFHTRHFTNYGVIAPYSTLNIFWREQLLHFFPDLTWHFKYAFVVRCRCAWHNFHTCMRHSTNYGVIAPYSTLKILWRELLLHCFPDCHEILHMHLKWGSDVREIIFICVIPQITELLPFIRL